MSLPRNQIYASNFCYTETAFNYNCFKFSQFFTEKILPVFIDGAAEHITIKEKDEGELVSATDKKIENLLISFLTKMFPAPVLSEEKEMIWPPTQTIFWLIDPLDGTHNYLAGIPTYGVTTTLIEMGLPTFVAIFLPTEEALFKNGVCFATIGKGAWRNTQDGGLKRIWVSQLKDLSKALLLIEGSSKNAKLEIALPLAQKCRSRRGLSSSWAGTRVAAGGTFPKGADILISINNKPWDNLPNALLIEEAGGKVTDFNGQEWSLKNYANLIGANETLHQAALDLINKN